MKRLHLRISGKVQGVYYRASAAAEAERLGLAGWVRNRRDGTVEAVGEGSAEALQAFVAWCQRGPPMARVDHVEQHEEEPAGLPAGAFDVRPTA